MSGRGGRGSFVFPLGGRSHGGLDRAGAALLGDDDHVHHHRLDGDDDAPVRRDYGHGEQDGEKQAYGRIEFQAAHGSSIVVNVPVQGNTAQSSVRHCTR